MTLKIKVQVDRLPDIEVGGHAKSQLGLRVSAVIAGAATRAERDLLLPWHWRSLDLAGAWNIHDAANWTLWLLRDGALSEVAAAHWGMALGAPADFDPAPAAGLGASAVGRFRQRLEDEVNAILDDVGLHALEEPGEGLPISGRTVFGLVESLTTLPAPVPAGMQLWTALTLDKEALALAEHDRFIAAPRFGAPDASALFMLGAMPVSAARQDDGWSAPYTVAPENPARAAEAWLQPSLPMTILAIAPTDTQRLIDLSTLLVRQAGPGFEANDWHATLANRIAEALDPSARVMAVLDETIRTALAQVDDGNSEKVRLAPAGQLEPPLANALREALRFDLVPATPKGSAPDRLRATLAALHTEVVAPRARNSRASAAPAAAFLERMAIREPALWPKIAPLLFAQGAAESAERSPATPRHQVISRARLAGAASIVAPRQDYLDDPAETPVIDDERAFQDWLFAHWTGQPSGWTLGSGERLLFGASARQLQQTPGGAGAVRASVQELGVINLMDLPPGAGFDLPFSLSAGAGGPITVELLLAEQHRTFFRLALAAGAAGQLTVTLDTDAQQVWQVEGTLEQVALQLRFNVSQGPGGGKQVMLAYRLTIGAKALDEVRLDMTAFAQKGRVALALTAGVGPLSVGIEPAAALLSGGAVAGAAAGQGQAMRAALALAHAGPAIGGLLGGWVPIEGRDVDQQDLHNGLKEPSERLRVALARHVNDPGGFQRLFDRATAAAGTGQARIDAIALELTTCAPTQQPLLRAELVLLQQLLPLLWAAAKQDAMRLAALLVPAEGARDADGLTQDAAPLTFLIDQLQDFDDSVDLSARMAGAGAWIGRSNQLAPEADQWWSLNVATLHVSQPDRLHPHARAQLGEDNAVPTRPALDWWMGALVDPLPMVVSETQGVRNALIRYECQSVVAEVQKRPQMDPRCQPARFARRPEAFLFPVEPGFPKLPPLTFGRYYHVLPYLVGHGGAVPPVFRSNVEDPCSWLARNADNGRVQMPAGLEAYIRTKHYLRTVPVTPPRLSRASRWPGLIDGVAALAAELAPLPPPLTLRDGKPARFFMDAAHTSGMITGVEAISNGEGGIRIEIGAVLPGAASTLRVRAVNLGESAPAVVLELAFDHATLAPVLGAPIALRIDVCGTVATCWLLQQDAAACAEDAPRETAITPLASIVLSVMDWKHCAIELTAADGNIELLPPLIRWGTVEQGALALLGERGMYPSELVSQNPPISILDGIGKPGTRVGPSNAVIVLKRPATTLATYDRWVNGVLGEYGTGGAHPAEDAHAKAAALRRVREALNLASSVATAAGAGERSLDDPAVEALWMEVVQVFPQYQVTQALVQVGSPFGDIDNLLGTGNRGHGADWANIAIAVDGDVAGAPAAGTYQRNQPLCLKPGSVYELRFYGAVAAEQPWFASSGVRNLDRFSRAVCANWRDLDLSGTTSHLGSPLVLKVEVASALMPEWYATTLRTSAAAMPFKVKLRRPPEVERECAAIALNPGYGHTSASVLERYQALRMIDRVGLLEQRWSWRGRPQAELAPGEITDFGENTLSPRARDFVDAAFFGRRHDDIGAIPEMRIGRAHAYAGRDQFAQVAPPRRAPTILDSDLDYRGGANLWRFALRAKSRYAALRPNNPSLMLRFSHTKVGEDAVNWWPLIVPDRADPRRLSRKPQRPNLMLVIPLTDGMDEGAGVPPLLALFNDTMFGLFNAADAIETVVELARHPYPAVERVDRAAGASDGQLGLEWKRLATARDALLKAESELARLLRADQRAAAVQLSEARKEVSDCAAACALAGDTYADFLGTATAAGYVEQLIEMRDEVNASKEAVVAALAAAHAKPVPAPAYVKQLEADIARFDTRLAEIADQISHPPAAIPEADGHGLGSPFAKYWPEYAPDPIRTGRGANGEPLAMRVDGPIGYSFDGDVEAGRFDHAGLLLTPVTATVQPWSMVKLRFRRLELPELLVGRDGKSMFKKADLDAADVGAHRFQLASELPKPPARTLLAAHDPVCFETTYEGVVIDLVEPGRGPGRVQMSLDNPESAGVKLHLWVEASVDAERLLCIRTGTHLGDAAPWSLMLAPGAAVEVRLIVAPKAVPITGNRILPVGEVSVRVRILPPDVAEQGVDSGWLSVVCMPITAGTRLEAGQAPILYLHGGGKATKTVVGPVRLSEFTPGVWCQFAAAMSRLRVAATVKSKSGVFEISDSLAVTELRAIASPDGSEMTLSLAGLGNGESVQTILLSADGAPDPDAQIEECLYAVVTRYVSDAFDRMRERPLSIHRLSGEDDGGSPVLGPPSWCNPAEASTAAPFAAGSGRIRILRVLRGKTRDQHGFEAAPREFPEAFFGTDVEPGTGVGENPFDAAGQVLGVSQPFEWKTAS